ncbi:MAG: hypothetical protein KDI20_00080 [Pseudomonadales bacterium]|nr:hypothetical protein [Pseudomonadales bacterium]
MKERWYLTVMVTDDGHIAQIFAVLRSAESGLNGYMTVKRLHQRQGQSIIVA